MHVLIVPTEEIGISSRPLDGIFQVHQAQALVRAGHNVGYLSMRVLGGMQMLNYVNAPRRGLVLGVPVIRRYLRRPLPDHRCEKSKLISRYRAGGLAAFKDYVRTNGFPDIIHAHNFRMAAFVADAIHDSTGLKFVITEHSSEYVRGTYDFDLVPFIQGVAKRAGGVAAVSSYLGKALSAIIDHKEILVMPNVIDEGMASTNLACNSRGARNKYRLVTIGSLIDLKNHRLLIRSFAKAFKGRKVQLRIGGDGPLMKDLITLSRSLGVGDQVVMLGTLSRPEVSNELEAADLYVHSSNIETFGVVLIEALMAGLPVISTDCGGPRDIINSKNGILVQAKNEDALAEGMTRILTDLGRYIPNCLRNDAISRFGSAAHVAALTAFYNGSNLVMGK